MMPMEEVETTLKTYSLVNNILAEIQKNSWRHVLLILFEKRQNNG